MSLCPSCGFAVPPQAAACPRCGASLRARLPLTVARYAALVLAFGGLIMLWLSARGAPTPHLTIAQLTAAQNLAYVQISGVVAESPRFSADSGALTFRVEDATGVISVSAFREQVEALTQAGQLPTVGDRITLAGTVRVREDIPTLTLNAAEAFSRTVPLPLPLALGALNGDLALQAVEVLARVIAAREPYPGLRLITIQDATGQAEIAFDESTRALRGDLPALAPDDIIRAVGVVTLYRGAAQITLRAASDLRVLPPDTPLATALAEPPEITPIAQAPVGAVAKIVGEVVAVESLSFGFKFWIQDESGRLALLLPNKIYDAVEGRAGLRVGARVQTFGLVTIFGGEPQLTPDDAASLTIPKAAAPLHATIPIPTLTLAQVGQTASVSGTITNVRSFSQGWRFDLQSGADSLTVLLWDNVWAYAPQDAITNTRPATVTGQLTQYQGALELVPQLGVDVETP
jgi:DNA/RNA endonuclease YhcR with UshA esterase domain